MCFICFYCVIKSLSVDIIKISSIPGRGEGRERGGREREGREREGRERGKGERDR